MARVDAGVTMLRRVGPAAQRCFDKAAEYDRLAGEASRYEDRELYRSLSDYWRSAAKNYQFIDRVSDQLASAGRNRRISPPR